jgi:hypothetical protein
MHIWCKTSDVKIGGRAEKVRRTNGRRFAVLIHALSEASRSRLQRAFVRSASKLILILEESSTGAIHIVFATGIPAGKLERPGP